MSFEINGATWIPQSTQEHANNIMARVNAILQEENVTDAEGNIVQLTANFANAFYLLSLAAGNRVADMDEKLTAAINSFNIALCDDQQIENLLPIAAISRNPGSYSTLNLTVEAEETGSCVIPAGTLAPFGSVNFVTKVDVTIPAGETQVVETVCDTIGPVVVLSGEITAFDGNIANLKSVTNDDSSVPGVAPETTNELRQRIIQGDTVKYSIDGCKSALEELTGIYYARVYFNFDATETITLPGNVVLQPRNAYIVVYGESPDLAKTYASYMSAETQNAPGAVETAKTQDYVTASGQIIPIKYDIATEQDVYVKITLNQSDDPTDQVVNQLKRDLLAASSEWVIGQDVTSLTTGVVFKDVNYTTVAYCQVSTDGETWTNRITTGCNVIPRLRDANITVEPLDD